MIIFLIGLIVGIIITNIIYIKKYPESKCCEWCEHFRWGK